MSFDRPEAWALKHFTSATLLEGFNTPRTRERGSVDLEFEAGWLPPLSEAQQRVGFNGTDAQDLNHAPLLVRPRVTIGLPGRLALTVAAVPPVRLFGIKALLGAIALERPLHESPVWTLGVRGYGQLGHVEGAFTCPRNVLVFDPGSPDNMAGCQAESSDVATFRYAGVETGFGYRTRSRLSPHAAVSVNYLVLAFQVNALTFGYVDRTRLVAQGMTMAASAGLACRLTPRVGATLDVFYTPLSVRRSFGAPIRNDALLTVRALISYRLR